jgi:hypothetical protein
MAENKSEIELERIRKLLESQQEILNHTMELLYETQETLIDDNLKTVSEDGEFTYDGKDYTVSRKQEGDEMKSYREERKKEDERNQRVDNILKIVKEDGEFSYDGNDYKVNYKGPSYVNPNSVAVPRRDKSGGLYKRKKSVLDDTLTIISEDGEFTYDGNDYTVSRKQEWEVIR